MEINISEIIDAKLEQMDRDGVIKRKIEEALEASVLKAITDELGGYVFRSQIAEQVKKQISSVAADCGLSAYNGFIAEQVQRIVRDLYTEDVAVKVRSSLEDTLLKKRERVKLSEIFDEYGKWVNGYLDAGEQMEHESYTRELTVKEDGAFTWYHCKFADRPLEGYGRDHIPDVKFTILQYSGKEDETISSLYLGGHDVKGSLKIGNLTEFEAFVVNLYYNKTPIELDVERVDQDGSFDVFED